MLLLITHRHRGICSVHFLLFTIEYILQLKSNMLHCCTFTTIDNDEFHLPLPLYHTFTNINIDEPHFPFCPFPFNHFGGFCRNNGIHFGLFLSYS